MTRLLLSRAAFVALAVAASGSAFALERRGPARASGDEKAAELLQLSANLSVAGTTSHKKASSRSSRVEAKAKETPAAHSRQAIVDQQGLSGNPMVWTMGMVYGGLTVIAILAYVVLADHGSHRHTRKARPEMGLPAGYVL
eukprot:TRINITY_DN47940_c0_g1_i1.p1 TRINITY_DN47940_c0_g1~~TRINITY_DN47940_c0_g1_i1.p1  ORF type:complete len:141 (-),score=21.90 TRINITY_DN47940_c0_g1_i1:132-554(-)